MPNSITIPSTIDDACEALGVLGKLITARKWERSAIVAAFVRIAPQRGGDPSTNATNRIGFESPIEFANRGIVGLTTPDSVRKYVQAWLDAHDGKYPKPGATRRLPHGPFPPMRTGTDGYSSTDGAAETIERIIRQHGAAAVIDGLANMPDEHVEDIVAAAREQRPDAAARGSTRAIRERAEAMGMRATGKLIDVPGLPDVTWMDVDRYLGQIHSYILLLAGIVRDRRDVVESRADQIEHEAELLHMVAAGARGVDENELATLLSDGAS